MLCQSDNKNGLNRWCWQRFDFKLLNPKNLRKTTNFLGIGHHVKNHNSNGGMDPHKKKQIHTEMRNTRENCRIHNSSGQ